MRRPGLPDRQLLLAYVIALATLLSPSGALAQDAYCMPCQAERWKSVESIMLERAQILKRARELVRLANQRGDTSLIRRTRAHLDNATARWNEIYQSALVLGGSSYKAHLATRLVRVETSYDSARAAWTDKVDQFSKLQPAIANQRAKILADMQGTIEQEAKERWQLGFNGVVVGAKAMALGAEGLVERLSHLPNGPTDHRAQIQLLNRLIGAHRTGEAGKAGVEASHEKYWEAGAEAAELGLEWSVAASSRMFPIVVATKPILTLGLDFVTIGLSHNEFREAQERLDDLRSVEDKWQFDIAVRAIRTENLKREREMAADAIEKQRAFEESLNRVRAEFAP